MQLNEVIEENSIVTISKRTRLSVENIEKLVHRDFSDMKRVKALGFISILEREFGIELDALRKECGDYFSSSPEEEFDARLVITAPESDEQAGGLLSKFFMLLVLFGIGYGAWYFLVARDDSSENNATISSTGFVGSIVNQAKAWLGDSSSLGAGEAPTSADGVWAKGEAEKNGTEAVVTGKSMNEERARAEKNDSAAEEQIIREVKQEQQEILSKAADVSEVNTSAVENTGDGVSSNFDRNSRVTDGMPVLSQEGDVLATEVPSMTKKKTEEAGMVLKEILPLSTKAQTEKKSKNKSNTIQIVTLHPTKKVWVGYTDLGTMKRAAKVIEEDIDFDTSSTSWILVAGHNAINFVVKGKTTTPKKRDKNYFLIKNGKIKDISKEEFQKLNKSTVW